MPSTILLLLILNIIKTINYVFVRGSRVFARYIQNAHLLHTFPRTKASIINEFSLFTRYTPLYSIIV